MFVEFRRRFWLPPRPHGEIIDDRTVSFLELFYDLVYVVVIGRAAHALAVEITPEATLEFFAVFGLIWIAWMNGTLYYELHGREDGRTRAYVFLQMLLLTLLAVFTEEAGSSDGQAFALVYVIFLAVLTWLWYTVRRQDTEEYMRITARYLTGMVVSMVVVGVSAFLEDGPRTMVWAGFVVMWILGVLANGRVEDIGAGTRVTESMVERYGLFIIIVLGEVVVGVATGLTDAPDGLRPIATGLIGLAIGFAYWWSFFDFVGRRQPVHELRYLWLLTHLPVTISIAAAGAAMVSLIGHAEEPATPAPTAWLLSGSVALGLLALVAQMSTLQDFRRLPELFRPVVAALSIAAVGALAIGWWAPVPWLLALSLVVLLSGVWVYAVSRWMELPVDKIKREAG